MPSAISTVRDDLEVVHACSGRCGHRRSNPPCGCMVKTNRSAAPQGRRAQKSDKAMLADAAVGKRLLTADKHIGGTTGERAAGKTGVLGARLVTVLANRPVADASNTVRSATEPALT